MNKTKIALYLALIFVAGAVAGGAVGAHYGRPFHHGPPPGHDPEDVARHIFAMMKERLKLTDDQARTIEPVFRAGFQEVRSIQEKTLAQVDEAVKRNHFEIGKLLTPEQRQELEKMDREREKGFRDRPWGHHGPPPGMRGRPGPGPDSPK